MLTLKRIHHIGTITRSQDLQDFVLSVVPQLLCLMKQTRLLADQETSVASTTYHVAGESGGKVVWKGTQILRLVCHKPPERLHWHVVP